MSDFRFHLPGFFALVEFDWGPNFAAALASALSALTATPKEHDIATLRALLGDLEGIRAGSRPTAEELIRAPLLTNWRLLIAPDGLRLTGEVVGHPVLGARKRIATSPVYAIQPARHSWARSWNRFYRLDAADGGHHHGSRVERLH